MRSRRGGREGLEGGHQSIRKWVKASSWGGNGTPLSRPPLNDKRLRATSTSSKGVGGDLVALGLGRTEGQDAKVELLQRDKLIINELFILISKGIKFD